MRYLIPDERELPSLRPGQLWGMLLYPGGRKEVRQYNPEQLQAPDEAAIALSDGKAARVRLGDAFLAVALWRNRIQPDKNPPKTQNTGFITGAMS